MNIKKYLQIIERFPRFIISYHSGFRITPKPWVLSYEITYKCNSRCVYCDRWRIGLTSKRLELTTTEAKKVVDEAKKIGITSISFTGGEPLLRKDIFEIAKYAKGKGIRCKLISNGHLISKDNISKIVESFDSVNVSLDSLDPTIHDNNRGVKNSYNKVINALELLSNYRNKIGFGFETVITRYNYSEVIKLNKFAQKMKCSFATCPVNELVNVQHRIQNKDVIKFDFEKFKVEWDILLKDFDYFSKFNKLTCKKYYEKIPQFLENPVSIKKEFICFAGTYNFYINPYGDVFGCESIRKSLGNVKEQSLMEIWKNMKDFRRKVSSKNRSCYCWSGCTAKDYMFLTKLVKPFRK